jgi:uncharacterized protein YqgC (DUF456 family)
MQAPNDPILWITLIVMLVGLVGSVLPGLPGVPLIFISALVYAIVTDFGVVGGLTIALLGVFAAVGALIGALFLGIGALFGLLLGTIGGVFLGEYLRRREGGSTGPGEQPRVRPARSGRGDWQRASRAAGGVLIGYVASAIMQGFLGLLSVIAFVIALFN